MRSSCRFPRTPQLLQSAVVSRDRTFLEIFEQRVAESRDATALMYASDGGWEAVTWAQWHDRSRTVAAALVARGLAVGERVGLVASSRQEWVIADVGIFMAGGVTVPVYPSVTPERGAFALNDSGARFAIVEGPDELAWIDDEGVSVEHLIALDPGDHDVESWDDFLAVGRLADVELVLSERSAALTGDDLATIVYTSGTTGRPKGVMLTHFNLAWEAETVQEIGLSDDDVQLLVLPLAHAFARMLYTGFVRCGGITAFARGRARLMDDLAEVQPTFLAGVPALYDAIHASIVRAAEKRGGFHQRLFEWSTRIGAEVCEALDGEVEVKGGLKLEHDVAMRLVGRRIRALFGGRIRFLISGQSPLTSPIRRFFLGYGLEILEGYGLAETSAATHLNRPGKSRAGTVGTPFEGVEAKIAADGEVLIRSPGVMKGYYGDPEATAGVLLDGWLRTGDIGELDEHDRLSLTGRRGDLIVTARGKRVSPRHIESLLCTSPLIRHCMVHGDQREYLTALITLDEDSVRQWAADRGLPRQTLAQLACNPALYDAIEAVVTENNTVLPSYQHIQKFAILDHDFSSGDDELTPTMELRRAVIESRHKDLLDSFYTDHY